MKSKTITTKIAIANKSLPVQVHFKTIPDTIKALPIKQAAKLHSLMIGIEDLKQWTNQKTDLPYSYFQHKIGKIIGRKRMAAMLKKACQELSE